jgi:hypothetical protein
MQTKTRFLPLSYIPNEDGFKFIGLTYEGQEIECKVVKDPETGLHSIENNLFQSLQSWRRKTITEFLKSKESEKPI